MKTYVYIISNQNNTVLYTGVTSALKERINKHKTKKYPRSFAARYNIDKLVYFEEYDGMNEAIYREKQIKAGSRKKKEGLINSRNPEWKDLYETLE
jgi:putative endonuclease